MSALVRIAVAVAGSLLGLLAVAGTAAAHNALTGSDPADGAVVATGGDRVTLTFDQPVQPGPGNQVAVTGPGNTLWATGQARVDGTEVTRDLVRLGPKGEYTVGYRVLSADGHVVRGNVSFTLTRDGGGTPVGTQDEAEEPGSGLPVWVWAIGAVALLGVGLVFALRVGAEPEGVPDREPEENTAEDPE